MAEGGLLGTPAVINVGSKRQVRKLLGNSGPVLRAIKSGFVQKRVPFTGLFLLPD